MNYRNLYPNRLTEIDFPIFNDAIGDSPLHYAAINGHKEILEYFMTEPMITEKEPNNTFGQNPMLYAAAFGHKKIVEFLISNGHDPNSVDVNGWNPLQIASELSHTNVKLLLENSTDEGIQSDLGRY